MAGVFVLNDNDSLVSFPEAPFEKEDEFQKLLAIKPELLPGDQINPGSPRKWLVLKREAGVPVQAGGPDAWYVDHVLVDQDGIPTFVEVKRQDNPDIRRKVVGQMLDYAANATAYWQVDALRAMTKDADAQVREKLGLESDIEAFWQKVKANLQVGRIRLLFVADRIPPELRRVVEFLNRQMERVEVLAVELRRYAGQNIKVIVPLVHGQEQTILDVKGKPPPAWTEEEVVSEISPELQDTARQVVELFKKNAPEVSCGGGPVQGHISAWFGSPSRHAVFRLWNYGSVEVAFPRLAKMGPFIDPAKRHELVSKLNAIQGLHLDNEVIDKFPSVPLKVLLSAANFDAFCTAIQWLADELCGGASPG